MIPKSAMLKVLSGLICFATVTITIMMNHTYPVSIGWPALALARLGFSHTWIILIFLGAAGITFAWRRFPGFSWAQVLFASAASAGVYCLSAFIYVEHAWGDTPVRTPFDADPILQREYQIGFASGYRDGLLGLLRTYCFLGEAETHGLEDGSREGEFVFDRCLGRNVSQSRRDRHQQRLSYVYRPWDQVLEVLSSPDAGRLAVREFIARHGWQMYSDGEILDFNKTIFDPDGTWNLSDGFTERAPITEVPWDIPHDEPLTAITHNGILYVVLHHYYTGVYNGLAYNPQTNTFPNSIDSFKPVGGDWYVWQQRGIWKRFPKLYEDEEDTNPLRR